MSGPPHAATNHYLKAKDTDLKRHKYYAAQIHKYKYIYYLSELTNANKYKQMLTHTKCPPMARM